MLSTMRSPGHSTKMMSKVKSACSSLTNKVKSRKQHRARKCVLELLSVYEPQRIGEIDLLMKEWKGREILLLQHLHQQYHLTDVGLAYFKAKYSRLTQLPPIYRGTMCRKCIRRKNGEQRLYHRLYKKKVTPFTVQRLKSTINVLRKLNHSNIMRLYDTFESRTRLVLITDLFDYQQCRLSVVLTKYHRYRRLNEWMMANLFDQMLQIVAHLHSKHYVHCDLNPDSFAVTEWSRVRVDSNDSNASNDSNEERKEQWRDQLKLKLIRVDQCRLIVDGHHNGHHGVSKSETVSKPIQTSNVWFAPPELHPISPRIDMWSLGILLYLMLTGTVPKRDPFIGVQVDGHKSAWNHLSFHARDLITKLVRSESEQRLSVDECWQHPWMRRFKNGYLQHNMLWEGYGANLKLYLCVLKMQSAIKKLLFLKDCIGMMHDFVPVNETRIVVARWIRMFEEESVKLLIVPGQIKDLIIDFV